VTIRNLGGFTGSHHAGLGGQAKVTQTGRTYDITGTADGLLSSGPLGESGDGVDPGHAQPTTLTVIHVAIPWGVGEVGRPSKSVVRGAHGLNDRNAPLSNLTGAAGSSDFRQSSCGRQPTHRQSGPAYFAQSHVTP
jgi:hypothetical protein